MFSKYFQSAIVYGLFTLALSAPCRLPAQGVPGPALTVDAAADRHVISPFIYGMAYPDAALAKELRLPINRWGGDGTTRYNWQVDSSNAGNDWFFMAGQGSASTPSAGPDALMTAAKSMGGTVLMTVPIIDYINKATTWDCSFPVSLFGPQQKTNPYVHPVINGKQTDAGNGIRPDGTAITLTKDQILRIHTQNTPALQQGWVAHFVGKFGAAANGGVPIYELDNEPGGWGNTHRDVHPAGTGDDELVSRSLAYAAAIKAADPTAQALGPGDFLLHYQSDGVPGDGKAEHGGLGQGNYYLQQFAAYEKAHGKRLLDYFDGHYYPLNQDGETDATRLEATRSLWDSTYIEKDWYGKYNGAINLIPSFHKWVDQYYPGTKIGISEYGWGDMSNLTGALVQADVLGIYGRERLDLACMFGAPKATDPGAYAFRLYRNYDGKGSVYGDAWVRSQSADQGKLSIYGAVRQKDGALTLVIINKTGGDLVSPVQLANFVPSPTAQVFRYSAANLKAIVAQPDLHVSASGLTAAFPANSLTLLVLSAADAVSGVVTLDGEAQNAPAQPVTFEFRDAASGQALFTRTTSVDASGAFSVSGVPNGSYNVRVKGPKNLAALVPMTKGSGATGGVSVFLPGGDANDDNGVDSSDFGILIGAFNTSASVPGNGYDATADFNSDGFVDSTDFGILIGNYGTVGAN